MKRLVFVCLTGLVAFGCLAAPVATTAIPAVLPSMPAASVTAQPAQSLTPELVQNMQVQLQSASDHPLVQLANGEYHAGSDPTAATYANVKLVPDHLALGDLDGDGVGDAAALLAENYGGTGVFVSLLALLSSAGDPVLGGATLIDDRPEITDLKIENGQIVFTGKIHGPNDPGCCAAEAVTETYTVDGAGLHLRRFASAVKDGPQRAIVIESPKDAQQIAAGTVQVKGTFTVPPFENTLVYHVTDASGREWNTGPFTVSPSANNGPGDFTVPVDLGMVPPGIPVLLVIKDVSAADGSILAMDSVMLTNR